MQTGEQPEMIKSDAVRAAARYRRDPYDASEDHFGQHVRFVARTS